MVCHCWYASSCYHTAREKTFSPVRSSLISLQGYLMEFSYHGEINVPGKGVGSSCTPALVLPFMEATWSLWVQALGSTDLGISILHMSRLAHWLVHWALETEPQLQGSFTRDCLSWMYFFWKANILISTISKAWVKCRRQVYGGPEPNVMLP